MPAPNKTFTPGKTEQTKAQALAQMDKIVENSSEKNRNFFIAYLGLLIYVQAIIFSTTDLQLLVSTDGLKLPLIDLNVPLVGFYVVVPIFIIALHFNFLQNLESHHYKLMQWQAAHIGGQVPRKFIYPFLFDFAILEQDGQFQRLVRIANSLLCYNLAPITLGLLLIRFSDRQDFMVTAWHYLLFVFDSYLVWKFGVAIRQNARPETTSKRTYRWPHKAWYFLRDSFRYGLHGVFGLLILLETVLTGLIGATSNEFFVERVQPWVQPTVLREFLYYSDKPIVKTIGQLIDRPIEWLFPRIAIDPTETVWKPDVSALEAEAKMAGKNDWVEYFNEQGKGFQPMNNSLRISSLIRQNLPRSQLSGMQLQGANLDSVQLQGANLDHVQMNGTYLDSAQLQGADLRFANLQDAQLHNAQMQRANLDSAQLQGIRLHSAQLQSTNLNYAQMQNAFLAYAQLQSADLGIAKLQGVDLTDAQLQSANLVGTQLQGADLKHAQLQGADLSRAQLQGADLVGAQLQGANLDSAQLQATDLRGTELSGVFLFETLFQSATFNRIGEQIPVFIGSESTGFLSFQQANVNDYEQQEHIANEIEHPGRQSRYLNRIRMAAKNKDNKNVAQPFYHAPTKIAQASLSGICKFDYFPIHDENKTKAISAQAFRWKYKNMQNTQSEYHTFPTNNNLKTNKEYQALLTDIDRKLCTLPECADIRDKIDGLDCKPFLKESQKNKHLVNVDIVIIRKRLLFCQPAKSTISTKQETRLG